MALRILDMAAKSRWTMALRVGELTPKTLIPLPAPGPSTHRRVDGVYSTQDLYDERYSIQFESCTQITIKQNNYIAISSERFARLAFMSVCPSLSVNPFPIKP